MRALAGGHEAAVQEAAGTIRQGADDLGVPALVEATTALARLADHLAPR